MMIVEDIRSMANNVHGITFDWCGSDASQGCPKVGGLHNQTHITSFFFFNVELGPV